MHNNELIFKSNTHDPLDEERNYERFEMHSENRDNFDQLSQTSEEYMGSANTIDSSQVQGSFGLRKPWQHESAIMDLLNYYTEQVQFH